MTPTTTRQKPRSALSELEKLEAKVAEHAGEASSFRRKHFEAQQRFQELTAQRESAFRNCPDQFATNGESLPGTAAAEIDVELEKLGRIDFSPDIARAENGRRLAEQELSVFRFEHAEALAAAFAGQGDDVAATINDALALAAAGCQAYQAHRGRYESFCGSLPGAISGRDVQSDTRVDSIAKAIGDLVVDGEITAPFSASLAPRGAWADQPRFVLGPDGRGWIKSENAR